MSKADYTNGVTNLVINWDDADGEYCAGQVAPTWINIFLAKYLFIPTSIIYSILFILC